MKIKNRLALNSFTILVLMAVIGAAAIIGIKFIERNIFVLTQKSTPYQIKTFNHQRALQAHAANLLKVAASDSIEEFRRNSSKCDESLAEEIKAAEELIKLGSTGNYEHDLFSANTKSIQQITDKRLALQRDTVATVAAMRTSLVDASKKLQGLDNSVRKLQTGATSKMVSNIVISADGVNQASKLAAMLNALKDIKIYVSRVMNTSDKSAVESMYDASASPLHEMRDYLGLIKWSEGRAEVDYFKKFDYINDKLTDAKVNYVKFLDSHDASAHARAVQAIKDAEVEITNMQLSAEMQAGVSKTTQDASADAMSASTVAFSSTNSILILSSEIIFASAVVDSQVNYCLTVKNIAEFDKTAASIQNEFLKMDATSNKLKAMLLKGNFKSEIRLLADSMAALAAVRNGFFGKDGASGKMRASLQNIEEVSKLNQKMKEMVNAQMSMSSKDVAVAQHTQETAVASVKSAVRTTTTVIVIIAAVAVLASLLLGKVIASSITEPIDEMSKMAEGFGSGDFSIRMDDTRKDEFGTLAGHFNQATAKLTEITKLLKDSITKLTVGSENLSKTAASLYHGAQEQVAQTLQSSVAMTEISATVETVAGHAHASAASSKEAHLMATNGKTVVARTVRGMHQISDSVIAAAITIGKLSESSEQIDSILSTINDIADQTNLLALNAAIEAARAGEQGRGFAVVADEVRVLARRTADATHEIADIIHTIQTDTQRSVSAMNDGKSKVEEGMKLSSEASDSLDAIVGVSKRGVDMAQLIATATDDQSKASKEVSQSMERISDITGTLKDSTAGIKNASEQLSTIAEELSLMSAWFRI